MISEIDNKEILVKDLLKDKSNLPILLSCDINGEIVILCDDVNLSKGTLSGMVISSKNDRLNPLGKYRDNWDMSMFTKTKESITIKLKN